MGMYYNRTVVGIKSTKYELKKILLHKYNYDAVENVENL